MGPLFSGAIVGGWGLCIAVLCFVAARFFLPARRAAVAAVAGAAGAGVGVCIAILVAIPFVGVGYTLSSHTAVVAYLMALGLGGIVGAIGAAALYVRAVCRRSEHAF
jgi:hypothetical protein